MMKEPVSQYQHSGAIGSSLLLVPLTGILASLILGVVYAYATHYNPLAWLAVIFVFVYGAAVGVVVASTIKASKCRNAKVASVLAVLVGLFALYGAWSAFLFVFMNRNGVLPWTAFPRFFVSPLFQWDILLMVNQNGWFEVFGGTPKGIVLWSMWAVEALIIVALIGLIGAGAIVDEVFCERCRVWASDDTSVYLSAPDQMEDLQRLSEGQLTVLESLDTVPADEYPRIQVDTKICANCEELCACKIKAVMEKVDKEGNRTESANDLTGFLLLHPHDYAELLALNDRPTLTDEEMQTELPSEDSEKPDEPLDLDV
jgi:hypothetical protein